MRDINLKATQCFEAVARLGTVTQAARELEVSPSAVSQQISRLEAQLGAKLFRREKRRLVLTLEGDRLFQTATQAFGAIRNAGGAVSRQHNAHTIAIRVSPSFGVRWLGPRIADFAAQHPEWNIRIDATPDFSAFTTEAIDIDLRYGLGGWSGLSVAPLMNDLVLPLIHPAYGAQLRAPTADLATQLADAQLIDSVKSLYRWDLWLAANRIELGDIAYPFRFDRSSMSIELAKQAGGVALDSATLCLPELLRGELAPLSCEPPVIDFAAYWLACPPHHLNRRPVRLFAEWLSNACRAHEQKVRAFLAAQGCVFQTMEGAELIGVHPNRSAAPARMRPG
ncbi:MAG: LysR substrate-binding domain-containing protein [Neomegalonema sp.]|nr:LysR substrate-binding domain-containing protein [Neomegalonema sp.]